MTTIKSNQTFIYNGTTYSINNLTDIDPSMIYLSAINITNCPDIDSIGRNDCYYPKSNPNEYYSWECDPGYFCLGPKHRIKCSKGFYCPVNTTQPLYCPPGYYCDLNATSLKICPENHFCPIATIYPVSCDYLAFCPKGTIKSNRYGLAAPFILILFLLITAAKLINRAKSRNLKQFQLMMKNMVNPAFLNSISNGESKDIRTIIELKSLCVNIGNQRILQNVNCILVSGKLYAIMGPSGCGKTTLLNVLLGKVAVSTGALLINGEQGNLSKFKSMTGYVPQEDIMHRDLTARDILYHSARTRLSSNLSNNEIKRIVMSTVSLLGISHIVGIPIGDDHKRGISGGQRKRVNIGIELVANTSILFCDEPTSGLDSSVASHVCANLSSIAKVQNLLIACIIHSPSSSAFSNFDEIILLSKLGSPIYVGPREYLRDYLSMIGFTFSKGISEPDFILDIANGRCPNEYEFTLEDLPIVWNQHVEGTLNLSTKQRISADEAEKIWNSNYLKNLNVQFLSSQDSPTLRSRFVKLFAAFEEFGKMFLNYITEEKATNCNAVIQFTELIKRNYTQTFSSIGLTVFELSINFLSGILVVMAMNDAEILPANPQEICEITPELYKDLCRKPMDTMPTAVSLLSIGIHFCGILFGSYTFGAGHERVVYLRETSTGLGLIPYFLSKIVADIPKIILRTIFYVCGISLFFSYRQSVFDLYVSMLALNYCTTSLGYLISVVADRKNYEIIAASITIGCSLSLTGTVPKLSEVFGYFGEPGISWYLQWPWQISSLRYVTEALWVKEVKARGFENENFTDGYFIENYTWDLLCLLYLALSFNLFTFVVFLYKRIVGNS